MFRSSSVKDSAQIRFYLFGRFQIERKSKPIQLPTRKTEVLLAYLIMNPGKHAREKIAALFWGDSSDTEARNSLRNSLAVINKNLGPNLLLTDRQIVEINPEYPLWVDALEFESQTTKYLADLNQEINQVNLDLYQADLLSDFYDDWIFPVREHYRSLLFELLLQMTQEMRSRSEYKRAVEFAHKVLAFDSANERAHQHLMFCYMAQGDRSAALRQYENCQGALMDELGVDPATATTALYEWIKQVSTDVKPFSAQITNLPIPLTSFIGRKRETAAVKQLLSSTRLLTITGPGGSGKTRQGIHVATDLLDAFEDGVWWVELAALTDNSLVPQAIAKALGVQEVANQPLLETIANYLQSKKLLLILDNCEHLIEACAQVTEYLLESCLHLKVIATSRESLNIVGESIWYVPTLSLPDPGQLSLIDLLLGYEGIRLFVERASGVRSAFVLTEQNASFVAQICHRLDGIPLAIELAAARIKVLTPEQIVERLQDRFQLLTGGSRTALTRHQTLQAVIDWSYDLLTEREQALFRRLGVFSGGWKLEAAEVVCSGENLAAREILDVLSNLVDKSLVIIEGEQDGESRYKMLETIRQYARKMLLKAGEESEYKERHLDYYVKLVESAKPYLGFFLPDMEIIKWVKVFDPEQSNLRRALKWSLTDSNLVEAGLSMAGMLHWFWFVRSQFTEGRDWLKQFSDRSDAIAKSVRAQAFLSAGFLACWQGDFASANASLEQSLKLFEELDEKSGVAFSLHGLGFAANGLGDHAQAGSMFGKCLAVAREIDDKWLISFALHFMAIGSSFQGNYELAREQFEECIMLIKEGSGNMQGIAYSSFHLGRMDRLQGDYASAHKNLAEGIGLFWQMSDRRGLGYALSGFACLALAQEEIERAAYLFGAVDSIREEVGSLLEEILQAEYEQAKATTQEILGNEKFDAAWSDGNEMALEQAVRFVLKEEESPGD